MAERYEAMFLAAVQSLAEISKALGIPDDEAVCANGNDLILKRITSMQAALMTVPHAGELTDAELSVLTLTVDVWNALCALGDHHPSDMAEHQRSIHDIQARVMARLARRTHPEFFTPPNNGAGDKS